MAKFEEMKNELMEVIAEAKADAVYTTDEEIIGVLEGTIEGMKETILDNDKFANYRKSLVTTDFCDKAEIEKYLNTITDDDIIECKAVWIIARHLFPLSLKHRGIDPEQKDIDINTLIDYTVKEAALEAAKTDYDLKSYLGCIVAEGDMNLTKMKLGIN